MAQADIGFTFDNTYARDLDGFYAPWQGANAPAPAIVMFNAELALELNLDAKALETPNGAAILAGSVAPEGAEPLAQAYAGHQFGGFSAQLGDGRALLLGEIINTAGERRDLQLKGSGRTPFSRGGDGKAVLGPILREYLMGEAMQALGIPTTRALAAVTTGEMIEREGPQPGAVLARVAASHLRVGTFQFFAARGETEKVNQLADYAINRHFPSLTSHKDKYLAFLQKVTDVQAELIAQWMQVGFVHGVMNTDNMTISGETIDYGPCAFIDSYDPAAVFSSIDRQGRYAYGNQPAILQWNLARLAETLLPLIDPDDDDNAIRLASNVVGTASGKYQAAWLTGMRAKIGLSNIEKDDPALIKNMYAAMDGQNVDFTQFFRHLADSVTTDTAGLSALFDDASALSGWTRNWRKRLKRNPGDPTKIAAAMNRVNPLYIPRNHLVEAALDAAVENADLAPFKELLSVLSGPFSKRAGLEKYEQPAPESFGSFTTFCGT